MRSERRRSTGELLFFQTSIQELARSLGEGHEGRELSLPDGVVFRDKDGHQRSHVRIRWFESPKNRTYREYALPAAEETPDTAIPESAVETVHAYDPADCPVFFGHYWLSSKRPERLARNVACVDSSVARGGSLCCYRWDG